MFDIEVGVPGPHPTHTGPCKYFLTIANHGNGCINKLDRTSDHAPHGTPGPPQAQPLIPLPLSELVCH